MAVTLVEFANEITGDIKRTISRGINSTMKMVAGKALRGIVKYTPVDTGRARSNWQVGLGSPMYDDMDPYHPYPKYSKGLGQATSERANAAQAIAAGHAVLQGYTGGDIFLGNDVVNPGPRDRDNHYIEDLNAGTISQQAPPNFVEMAVFEALEGINGIDLIEPGSGRVGRDDASFDFGGSDEPF